MEKSEKYLMALDEGTTSTRAVILDEKGKFQGEGRCAFEQHYPNPGWVEHDPNEIWTAQKKSIKSALDQAGIEPKEIDTIGISNQRETTLVWDKDSGEPLYRAIVWQDRRTAEIVETLDEEYGDLINKKTGLIPDAYFSGSKIKWLLDNEPDIRKKTEKGEAIFGTMDSYLIFRLTGGKTHLSDYTNTSRTMLFNIESLEWDSELLEIFDIPETILPEPVSSSEIYGYTNEKTFGAEVPISGSAGDQQSALFGQACFEPGMVKNTCGTGSFILMNTGNHAYKSEKLLTTIAWGLDDEIEYALEGSIFIAGAGIQWLRDSLELIEDFEEVESLAKSLDGNDGVYLVPAFVGLGAPYWDPYARGILVGLTRGTGKAHLARAALEAIGYFTREVLDEMEESTDFSVKEIRVDGGAAKNDFLMNFQSDITSNEVLRPKTVETTALGAAFLSGLSVDIWDNKEDIKEMWSLDRKYEPKMSEEKREALYRGWKKAVRKSLGWEKDLKEAGLNLES